MIFIMGQILPSNFRLKRYGLDVRFVTEDDAQFIVELRTDEKLSRYLNKTTPDINAQKEWTKEYKKREAEGTDYYFVFEKPLGVPIGVCRIYNITETDFTIGSWLFSPKAPVGAAILADIITREIAFDLMPQKRLLFDVRNENSNVLRYQHTYKPTVLKVTDVDTFFELSKENFDKYKQLHLRMFNSCR